MYICKKFSFLMRRLILIVSLIGLFCSSKTLYAASPLDNITITPAQSICNDGGKSFVDLSSLLENIPLNCQISWERNGIPLTSNIVRPAATSTYTVIFKLGNDVRAENVTVTVIDKPTVSCIRSMTVCQDSIVTLQSTGSTNAPKITWYNVEEVDLYADGHRAKINKASTFVVMGSNDACKSDPARDTLNVKMVAKTSFKMEPNPITNKEICKGDAVDLMTLRGTDNISPAASTILRQEVEWELNGQAVANPNNVNPDTTTNYTALYTIALRYNPGNLCGLQEDSIVRVARTVPVKVKNCVPTITASSKERCESAPFSLYINKNGLTFTKDSVKNFPADVTFVSENSSRIVYAASVNTAGTTTYTPIVNYTQGGMLFSENLSIDIKAKPCAPTVTFSPDTACEGKPFKITINATNSSGNNIIKSINNPIASESSEQTPFASAVATVSKNVDNTIWTMEVKPGSTTTYSFDVEYYIGASINTAVKSFSITPQCTICSPTPTSLFPDSICRGYEDTVFINTRGNDITDANVTWSNNCGAAAPIYDSKVGDRIYYKITPTQNCTYTATLNYNVGATPKTEQVNFPIKTKNCDPELALDTCPPGEDCTFNPSQIGKGDDGSTSGGIKGDAEYTLCEGQNVIFYVNRVKGSNIVQNVTWLPSISCDGLCDGTEDKWKYKTVPTSIGTHSYTASINYLDENSNSQTSSLTYTINVKECPPTIAPNPDIWNSDSTICKGNDFKFYIPKKYKNSTVVSVTPSEPMVDSVGTDHYIYTVIPSLINNNEYSFSIVYNNTISNNTSSQNYTVYTKGCAPSIAQSAITCEGDSSTVRLNKNGIITDASKTTWNGLLFTPRLVNDYKTYATFKVRTTDGRQTASATVEHLDGSRTASVDVDIVGKTCAPSFTVTKNKPCPKEVVTIKVSGGNYNIDRVEWSGEGRTPSISVSSKEYKDTVTDDFNYYAKIYYSYGAEQRSVNDTVQLAMQRIRRIWTIEDTTVCRGDSISLNSLIYPGIQATLVSETVAPYFLDSFNAIARVASCVDPNKFEILDDEFVKIYIDTAIWVTAMQDTVICNGDTIQLKANGVGTFKWYDAKSGNEGNPDYTEPSPFLLPRTTRSYVVTDNNACGSIYDTTTVEVKNIPDKPRAIYGNRTPLFKNYYLYSVRHNQDVDSVSWEYPSDWTVESVGADSILFRIGRSSGSVKVHLYNMCGSIVDNDNIIVQKAFTITPYPNPTSGIVNLQAKNCLIRRISVHNFSGTQMLPEKVFEYGQSAASVNLSHLNPGMYTVIAWIEEQDTPLLYKVFKR